MAQISDVMHASAVLDAARQELAWAYRGEFTDVPEPMKGAVHTISEVLNEAEMRWVKSTREEEAMAAVVDKENSMAVVTTGHEEQLKRVDVGVVKEVNTRSIGEAERKIKRWLVRLEEVACDMRAVARKELLGDCSATIDNKLSARWLPCLPRTRRAARIADPTIGTVALELEKLKKELEKLKKQYDEEFGHSTGLPLAATCTEQPACSSAAGGQEETETSAIGDVLVERDDCVKQRIIDMKRSSGVLGAESWLSLAYCGFFIPKGKGHGVVTRDLLNQWCSLGITTRVRGSSCIRKLVEHSFVLDEHPAASLANDDEETKAATLLRMEDLMHDFARYHLGDRLVIVDGGNGATSSSVNNKSSSAYLALVSNFDAKQLDIMSNILPTEILALRFEGCGETELSDGAFASFGKYLRLLDLSGYSEKKMLPDSIRHLKQLRYLKAPGIQDQELSRSITGLHELRYLILHGSCQLKNLTEAFQMLRNLLHLDLSECSGLKALPTSFGRIWTLEHLDLSASGIEALPESFGWLRNLSHLDISRCSGLQDLQTSFQHFTKLRHLDLSGLSGLQALPMVSLPRELRHLNISGCSGLQKELPAVPVPSELRHLDLSGCSSVVRLPGSYTELRTLVHLNMSGCSSLTNLTVCGYDSGEWTMKLEHLDLSYCSQLRVVPDKENLPMLQYLDMSAGCSGLEDPYHRKKISSLVHTIRSRGGRASGPHDATLRPPPQINLVMKSTEFQ